MSAAAAPKYRALPLGGSLAANFDKRPDGTTLVDKPPDLRWKRPRDRIQTRAKRRAHDLVRPIRAA